MRVVVVNCGSSSIKYEIFEAPACTSVAHGLLERIGTADSDLRHEGTDASGAHQEIVEARAVADHRQGFELILDVITRARSVRDPSDLLAFGHRVVHGGEDFRAPVIVDAQVLQGIRALAAQAPLHNPANALGIEVLQQLYPAVPHVAVFDTAFHHTLPPHAFHYALPQELYRLHHVRRYGFHGTSHQYVVTEAARYLGIPLPRFNAISLHLGNGASAAAVAGGHSVDTSMGLTPLEGLIMGTRCGDIDPAIPFYLARTTGKSLDEIETLLNHESGLKGICGANDMREVQTRAECGDAQAELAIAMFSYRIKKYIGAYSAVLDRVDALLFTGGIGENSALIRSRACSGLAALGIRVDESKNSAVGRDDRSPASAFASPPSPALPAGEGGGEGSDSPPPSPRPSASPRFPHPNPLPQVMRARGAGQETPAESSRVDESEIAEIQAVDGAVKILVVATNEEREIARQTVHTVLQARGAAVATKSEESP